LEKIGEVLGTSDLQTRNELIAGHLARLEDELAETQAAVASLRQLLQGSPPDLVIESRREEPIRSAAVSGVVASEDLGPWFQGAIGELYATVAGQKIATAGPPGAVIATDFFSDERGELTIFLPCAGPVRPVGRVTVRTLPAVELATTVHVGSHVDIDRTYGSLATYVTEHALAVDGPIRERYLVGRQDTSDEGAWRTEIGWPIFHTGPAT
jgi:effector-binding domain-containing protein